MKYLFSFLLVLGICLVKPSYAEELKDTANHSKGEEKFNPTEVIMHHIKDAHSWHLFDRVDKTTGEEHAVSIPLPCIVYYNGHLDFFMSSVFHHGESIVKKGDREYILYHESIYMTQNGKLEPVLDEHQHPTNIKPLDFFYYKECYFNADFSCFVIVDFHSYGQEL